MTALPTAYRRPVTLALLAAWVGVVAYLTLTPAGYTPPLTLRGFFCVACGELDGSDILRNWILFLPGGALAVLALGTGRGITLAVGLSAVIEIVQVGVPGREPAFQDLLFNSAGALTGAAVIARGLAPWARRLLAVVAAAAWIAPAALLVPGTTPYDLYGQWTPRFGNSAHYGGRIVDASVGGLTVESRRSDRKEALDAAIVARAPIRLRLVVGRPPETFAPVFQVFDGEQQGVVELGALGADLVLRGRNPARALGLDQPDVRWDGALAGVPVGDTVELTVERGRGSVCMSVAGRERCGLAPSLGDGWGFVLNLEGPAAWFRALMSLLWALGLGGVLGASVRPARKGVAAAAAVAAAGYVAAHLSPDVAPSMVDAAAFVTGAAGGALLRPHVIRFRAWASEPA